MENKGDIPYVYRRSIKIRTKRNRKSFCKLYVNPSTPRKKDKNFKTDGRYNKLKFRKKDKFPLIIFISPKEYENEKNYRTFKDGAGEN
ncbi:MAG: hypothetical protein ABDH49_04915 [Candidatus Hydrothermales bacterium]